MQTWLLLTYKIPNEPSAPRVYVWRKLKKLGAIALHDALWVLPAQAKTREQLQWLASEIREKGGEASLWEAQELFTGTDLNLPQRFVEQVNQLYGEILETLEQTEPDLLAVSKQYQHAKAQDYFQSELGVTVREMLMRRQEGDKS